MATPLQKSRAESLPGNERGVPGAQCCSLSAGVWEKCVL